MRLVIPLPSIELCGAISKRQAPPSSAFGLGLRVIKAIAENLGALLGKNRIANPDRDPRANRHRRIID
jgi:hypothetical protein